MRKILAFFCLVLLLVLIDVIWLQPKKSKLYVFFNHHQKVIEELPSKVEKIDALLPVWAFVKDSEGNLENHDLAQQKQVENWILNSKKNLPIYPVVNNHNGIDWQGKLIEEILQDSNKQDQLIQQLIDYAIEHKSEMLVLDFENFNDSFIPKYFTFIEKAQAAFNLKHIKLALCLSPYWIQYSDLAISASPDLVILMLYDEHWSSSPPGPIAGKEWFQKTFFELSTYFPMEKIIVALGNYGYDWTKGQQGSDITVREAFKLAQKTQSQIVIDPKSQNPMFSYTTKEQIAHEVWFLDAETFKTQMEFVNNHPLHGIALWQLGAEDPKLWNYISTP